MKNKQKVCIQPLKFPKKLKLCYQETSQTFINVPVEFKPINEKNFKDTKWGEDKSSKNIFQVFRNTCTCKREHLKSIIKQREKEFFDNIFNRAIFFGERNNNYGRMGGVLSLFFNAEIDIKGRVFIGKQEYKIVILYMKTTFPISLPDCADTSVNVCTTIFRNNKPIVFTAPLEVAKGMDDILLCIFGRFTVTLKKL